MNNNLVTLSDAITQIITPMSPRERMNNKNLPRHITDAEREYYRKMDNIKPPVNNTSKPEIIIPHVPIIRSVRTVFDYAVKTAYNYKDWEPEKSMPPIARTKLKIYIDEKFPQKKGIPSWDRKREPKDICVGDGGFITVNHMVWGNELWGFINLIGYYIRNRNKIPGITGATIFLNTDEIPYTKHEDTFKYNITFFGLYINKYTKAIDTKEYFPNARFIDNKLDMDSLNLKK